ALQEAFGGLGAGMPGMMTMPGVATPSSDPADSDLVVDVEARVVPDADQAPAADAGPAARQRQTAEETGAVVGQFIEGRYTDAHGARQYKLFLPPRPSAQPCPLVVMLHGCTQDPDDFAAGTGMNDLALAQGFAVLYPAQSQQGNAQRCWNWFKHNHQQRDRGEPALLAGMTRAVMAEHGIDPRRVYVAGLSAGGAMAAILGDAYPDLFAAVGVHSGLPSGAASDVGSAFAAMQGGTVSLPASSGLSGLPGMGGTRTAKPARQARPPGGQTPTIVFHGDQDTTVHPINGQEVIAACTGSSSVPGAGGARGTAAGVERGRASGGRSYTRQVHHDAKGQVIAEHWVVHGAGHAWSGGRPQGTYTDMQGPDASREMVRFFIANGRQRPR
ncbi:MAG: PHB depolymerase family esterase, partial [Rubrivivax sp.]